MRSPQFITAAILLIFSVSSNAALIKVTGVFTEEGPGATPGIVGQGTYFVDTDSPLILTLGSFHLDLQTAFNFTGTLQGFDFVATDTRVAALSKVDPATGDFVLDEAIPEFMAFGNLSAGPIIVNWIQGFTVTFANLPGHPFGNTRTDGGYQFEATSSRQVPEPALLSLLALGLLGLRTHRKQRV